MQIVNSQQRKHTFLSIWVEVDVYFQKMYNFPEFIKYNILLPCPKYTSTATIT